jgi:hypothetical protein
MLALEVDACSRPPTQTASLDRVAGLVDGALPDPAAVPVDEVVRGLGGTHISDGDHGADRATTHPRSIGSARTIKRP